MDKEDARCLMPERYVIDTHTLFWYLTASPKLSVRAHTLLKEGENGKALFLIPSIVLAELFYVIERTGARLDFENEYEKICEAGFFDIVSLSGFAILDFPKLSNVVDMHDRIIAGVAYREKVPIITRDKDIRKSKIVKVIW